MKTVLNMAQIPPRRELRRVSRDYGQSMLFAAAQDVARQQGRLDDGRLASFETSAMTISSYALKTKDGELIARIPLIEARQMLSFRRKIASQLVRRVDAVTTPKGRSAQLNLQQIRLQDEKVRAMAWALSHGRRFPYMGSQQEHALIALVLLFFGILPGLLAETLEIALLGTIPCIAYLIWLYGRTRAHRKIRAELLSRWRGLGRPDPAESFFHFDGL